MRNIADNRLFNMILLFTIIGEFFLPYVLEQCYVEYNGKIMVMSALGSPQSPVGFVYNLWLVWIGGFLAFTAWVYFEAIRVEFPVLSVFISLSIAFLLLEQDLFLGFSV